MTFAVSEKANNGDVMIFCFSLVIELVIERHLSSRLANRVQLSSDKLKHYIDAIEEGFGYEVDYPQIVKSYEGTDRPW